MVLRFIWANQTHSNFRTVRSVLAKPKDEFIPIRNLISQQRGPDFSVKPAR